MSLTFDPNSKKGKKDQPFDWATYCPRRTTCPAFKVHANRGMALNACLQQEQFILYQLDEKNAWQEVYRREGDATDRDCEGCTDEDAYTHRRWVGKKPGETLRMVNICRACERAGKLQ